MEHIKNILEARKATLFAVRGEKGSREWSAFNSVRGDRIEMFPVATPQARTTPRYANIVHISREPRHLTPRFSH
jgi:hypothetical protein